MSVTLVLSSTLVYSEEPVLSKKKRSLESNQVEINKPQGIQKGPESLLKRAKQSLTNTQFEEDKKRIVTALGGAERSNIESFEKSTRHCFQSIVEAALLELAEFREMNVDVGFGGFKKARIKYWKLVVVFDKENRTNEGFKRISEVFIGYLFAIGGFAKVYNNFNKEVLLIPRKDKKSAIKQMENSYLNICFFHDKCELTQGDNLLKILPPIPKCIMIGERPVMIAVFATSFENLFCRPPVDKKDVLYRLRLIIHVARSILLAHEYNLVHGDLKPSNLLISHQGFGQPHDLGGSCIFSSEDAPEKAAIKFRRISRTPHYTYYGDYEKGKSLQEEVAAVNDYLHLGRAGDVFALGITTIEILTGWVDQDMVKIRNSIIKYSKIKKKSFVSNKIYPLKEITTIKSISPQCHESFQKLLKGALHPEFRQRISVKEYGDGLVEIFQKLKTEGAAANGVSNAGNPMPST